MSNIPMLPSVAAAAQPAGSFTCGGFLLSTQRPYLAAAGTIVSVAVADDITQLSNRGWLVLPGSGTTAQRPTSLGGGPLTVGTFFNDTTVGSLVVYDGASWRRIDTGAAV